jgi:alkylhydroperoxidase family enzyme
MDLHSAVGTKEGISLVKLEALEHYLSSPLYTPRERVALRYADAITRIDDDVSDGLFSELRAAFPTEAELIELTAFVALENFLSKLHHAFLIEAQGFCPLAPGPGGVSSAR